MSNANKDFTGEITGHVRSRDFLEGEWNIHTEMDEQPDGTWVASALDGKYTTTGDTAKQAQEKIYEVLYNEGLKGGY